MRQLLGIENVNFNGKIALVRVDFNVPMQDGVVTDETRIDASLETITSILKAGAGVILISHLGRPKVQADIKRLSLAPIAKILSEKLKQEVKLIEDWEQGVNIKPNEVVILENIRFWHGEQDNNLVLAEKLSRLADIFVMDAFACAHRAHSSTEGITRFVKYSVAGKLLQKEVEALDSALETPKQPVLAIVGGSKVSCKISILERLVHKVNCLILGGGIANTFLAASGIIVGKSLYEPDLVPFAKEMLDEASRIKCEICLPIDVVVAEDIESKRGTIKYLPEINFEDKIFDVGPRTSGFYEDKIKQAATIIWNGPVGAFEYKPFANGTESIAKAISASKAYVLAGGGDTTKAINTYSIADDISYISTGGGSFLEYLEGRKLPAISALVQCAKKYNT